MLPTHQASQQTHHPLGFVGLFAGIYEKLGLKEEEVTRIQTGGPDGDLGCNALLQTKSKTIAVVDGSGVVYDPKGACSRATPCVSRVKGLGLRV